MKIKNNFPYNNSFHKCRYEKAFHKAMVHVKWDNGRKLAVIPGEDSFQIIKEKSRDDGAR